MLDMIRKFYKEAYKMKQKFKALYDEEGDVLTIYNPKKEVKESIEVSEEIILDVDKNMKLVNLELMDAYKFLHTINSKISKSILQNIDSVDLDIKNYRNYWIITLIFKHKDQIIMEKLPAFSSTAFKSPLIASASA